MAHSSFPAIESDPTFRGLSPARQHLITLAQKQLFGTIYSLIFRAGEPGLDPPPRVVCRVKPGGHNTPRPQARAPDFVLTREWVVLFEHLDAQQDGVVLAVEVAHGLPLYFEYEQSIPA
jgi:hypothetical protein